MGQFINDLIDAVDSGDFDEALLLKADKATTYTITQVNTALQAKQPTGDYTTNTALTDGLATKQDTGDYALHSELTNGLATKQDTGDYALHSELTDGLATKQDTGDYALHSELADGLATKQDTGDFATNTALTDGLNTKQDTGDFATNTALTDGLATKQDTGDFATNTALTDGLATKAPTGDYATNTALTDGLATKAPTGDYATNTALTDGLATKQATGNYALQEDIPSLAGGYSVGAVDNLLALKADKSELVYRETGEVDANGDAVRDTAYSLSQSELGTKLKEMDDATTARQMAGDYITRSEAQQGDASASMGGAIAGGLLGTASVVWSGVTSGGQTVTKTVGDVFKDIGDAFGDGDGGSTAPSINYNTFVTKPGDWDYSIILGDDTLDTYTAKKAKNTPTLENGNLQIKSTTIIDPFTSSPDAGYKFQVEGDTKIKNGTSKYLDCYNNKVGIRVDADLIDLNCDIKLVGDTCVDGDLKVSGVLKNGADKPYILQEDHDADITTITDILTDITDAIPTDANGNNEIPANETLAYTSQITGLQTQVDNLNYPTIENVDNLFDARLQSVGVVDENLALLHYDKTEVDALIPDVSSFETTTQLDTRLADYTTISLFEAHENLMELELAGKADTTAIPDVSSFITSADLPDTTGFALSSAIPDVSSFITNSTNSLANYDTSSTISTNHYTKDETDALIPSSTGFVDGDKVRIKYGGGLGDLGGYLQGYSASGADGGMKLGATSWNSNDVDGMYFRYNGNIGVKQTLPAETLDILGSLRVGNGDGMLTINERTNTYGGTTRNETIALQTTIDGRTLAQGASYGQEPRVALALQPDYGYVGVGSNDPETKLTIFKPLSVPNTNWALGYNETETGLSFMSDITNWALGGYTYGTFAKATPIPVAKMWFSPASYNSVGSSSAGYHGLLNFGVGHTSSLANTPRMSITTTGRVGIGTQQPDCPLEVGSGTYKYIDSSYQVYGRATPFLHSGNQTISANFYFPIEANEFYARSDERIKENIEDVNDTEALDLLRLFKPKKYEYKDKVEKGAGKVFGFIAQDIKELLPECVNTRAEVIPNILETANVSESNVITFSRFDTSNLVSNTSSIQLVGVDGTHHNVNIVDVIDTKTIQVDEDLSQYIGSFDEEGNVITQTDTTTISLEEYKVLEEKDGYVLDESNTYTKTTTTNVGNNILVRGEKVDDFLSISKNYLWTIATSALQQVDRELQVEKARNDALEARLSAIEEKLSNITV